MMNKFMFLTTYSMKKKLKSKSFLISNLVLLILLVGLINIDHIIHFFGGEFNETIHIYVLDQTEESYDLWKENLENVRLVEKEEKMIIEQKTEDLATLKEKLKNKNDIIIELVTDEKGYLAASIISNGYIDTFTYQSIVQSIQNTKYQLALEKSDIDREKLAEISLPVSISRVILDEEKNSEEENNQIIMSVVFPVLTLPFFMLIVLLVQMIGSEINEEKSTKSMEVILSCVPAKVHFFSKLVANNLFVILQALLLFGYGLLGLFIRSLLGGSTSSSIGGSEIGSIMNSIAETGLIDQLTYIIPITLLLMVLSFVAYSLIAGILASMTVNAEDYQQIQGPIMIICVIGYYLSMMAGMFHGSILIKILSYVPLISCLVSPALFLIGEIGLIDCLISIVVLVGFIWLLTKYGLRIYKVGILNYSTDNMWRKVFRAVRKN